MSRTSESVANVCALAESPRHAYKLAKVHDRPDGTAGVLSEHGRVVIGDAIGVEEGDHHV